MADTSLVKLGAACSVALGILYVFVGVVFLRLPPEQRAGGDLARFLASFAASSLLYTLLTAALAIGGFLAIVAARAILETLRPLGDGPVISMTYVAMLGFALTIIDSFRILTVQSSIAAAYVRGDASTKAAVVAAASLLSLDPSGVLRVGGVGLWVLVLSLLILRRSSIPAGLAWVGLALTVLDWLVVAGNVVALAQLRVAAVALSSLIVAPVWYIWMGVTLWRSLLPSWSVRAAATISLPGASSRQTS